VRGLISGYARGKRNRVDGISAGRLRRNSELAPYFTLHLCRQTSTTVNYGKSVNDGGQSLIYGGVFDHQGLKTCPEYTHASTCKLNGHAPLSAFSPIVPKLQLQAIMPNGRQVKRARAALGGLSLAHPSKLIPPGPPNAGLRLCQKPKKGGKNKKSWLQEQCVRRQKRMGIIQGSWSTAAGTVRQCSLGRM